MIEELRNDHIVQDEISVHTFIGTETDLENAPVPSGVSQVVAKDKTRAFRKCILDSDVVIYDLNTADFDEVDHVIKTFKTSEYEDEKILILISSVMTWVNTPARVFDPEEELKEGDEPEVDTEPEEGDPDPEPEPLGEDAVPPPKILNFREKDFHLRVPSPRFQQFKTLETLALSSTKAKPKFKAYVLCAGILYGNGERVFYNHFKKAWLQSPKQLPFIGDGDNRIPTIHVIDLSRLVK